MIRLENLSYAYSNKSPLLQELSLVFPAGAITAVVGPNGCGKSTLLKVCAGLLKPKAGAVLLDGCNLHSFTPRNRAKRISLLQQHYPQIHLQAGQVVLAGRNPYRSFGYGFSELDRAIAEKAMVQTDCLHLKNCTLSSLSGGEQQRVFLAMALAQQSDLILLDEPTAALDIQAALNLLNLLQALQQNRHKTIIIVLHDLDLALRYAQHIIVMEAGRIVVAGNPQTNAINRALEQVFRVRLHALQKNGQVFYGFTSTSGKMPECSWTV